MFGKIIYRILLILFSIMLSLSLVAAQESAYGVVREIISLLIHPLPIDTSSLVDLPAHNSQTTALPIALWSFSANCSSQISASLTYDELQGVFQEELFRLPFILFNNTQAIQPGENFCQMIRREAVYTATDNQGTIAVKRAANPNVPLAGHYTANIYFNLITE